MDNIPCRVMADLARHEADLRDAEQPVFDETDEMCVGAVVPFDIVRPVMELLQARRVMKQLKREGKLDPALEWVIGDFDALHEGCLRIWKDL